MIDNNITNNEIDIMEFERQYKKQIEGNGVDYKFVSMMFKYSYDDFIALINKEISDEINSIYVSAKTEEYASMKREEYNDMKAETLKVRSSLYEQFVRTHNAKKENKIKEFKFPLKEILNGNFNTYDKKLLTDDLKKRFRVDDLPEYCYDIYFDEKTGFMYPIYYDYTTTNKAFITFSEKVLKGINKIVNINMNHKIPLLLFDRDLLGIDFTHSVNSELLNVKAIVEARKNPYFTMRECAKVDSKKTDVLGKTIFIKYAPTIGSWCLLWNYSQCFNTYRSQSRQTGKTYDIVNLLGAEFAVAYEKLNALAISYDETNSKKIKADMVQSANNLPLFMKFHNIKTRTKKGVNYEAEIDDVDPTATKFVTNDKLGNTIKIAAIGKTEESGTLVGRGLTLEIIVADEVGFYKNLTSVCTGIFNANNTAKYMAEQSNKRYGIHFTTTPGTLDTKHGKALYNMISNNMAQFDFKLLELPYSELKEFLQSHKMHFFNLTFEYDILGFDEEWLKVALANNPNGDDFEVDILLKWKMTSKGSYISEKHLNRIDTLVSLTGNNSYFFKKKHMIYAHPTNKVDTFEELIAKTSALSIGIDIAGGKLNDSTVFYAVDLISGNVVFTYKNNQIGVNEGALLYCDLLHEIKKINPDIFVVTVPESNGVGGSAFIEVLLKDKMVEQTIFFVKKAFDKRYNNTLTKSCTKRISDDYYIDYGSLLTPMLRNYLTTITLDDLVDKYPSFVKCQPMLDELVTLVKKNGKVQAGPDSHDDVVLACLHAVSVIFYEPYRNMLRDFFNFNIDFNKFTPMPLIAHTISHVVLDKNKEYNEIDGKIEWKIVSKTHKNLGDRYEEIEATKMVNGRRIAMTQKEIEIEAENNLLLYNDLCNLKKIDTIGYINKNLYDNSNMYKRGEGFKSNIESEKKLKFY